jgi:hypothetical protein
MTQWPIEPVAQPVPAAPRRGRRLAAGLAAGALAGAGLVLGLLEELPPEVVCVAAVQGIGLFVW